MRKVLALVVLGLVAASLAPTPAVAGGGAHCAPDISDQRTNSVRMAKNCFHPTIARVDVGEEVTFISEDPVPHTVTGAVFAFGDMDDMNEGDRRAYRFDEEGIYPYVCIIHPGMMGAIVVGDGKGPGDGLISETTRYTAGSTTGTGAGGGADSTSEETTPTSAKATPTIEWLVALVAFVGLAVFAFVSLRPRRRAATHVASTTNA